MYARWVKLAYPCGIEDLGPRGFTEVVGSRRRASEEHGGTVYVHAPDPIAGVSALLDAVLSEGWESREP
jgi:hypothetical protein